MELLDKELKIIVLIMLKEVNEENFFIKKENMKQKINNETTNRWI